MEEHWKEVLASLRCAVDACMKWCCGNLLHYIINGEYVCAELSLYVCMPHLSVCVSKQPVDSAFDNFE